MQLSIIKQIQLIEHPILDLFFQMITMLGEEVFILVFLTILYWTVNKKMAQFVGYCFFISLLFNTGIKEILHMPRPIGMEGIRSLRIETATGYSFPSGHTQAVSSLFGSLALFIKKRKITIICALAIIMVGLSRLYLGLHWPIDVIGGMTIAFIILFIAYFSFKNNMKWFLLILVILVFTHIIFMYQDSELVSAYALLIGFSLGMAFENHYINFEMTKHPGKNMLRIIIGLLGIIILKEGLKWILPHHLNSDFIRYTLIAFYGIGLMPYIIKKFNLQ